MYLAVRVLGLLCLVTYAHTHQVSTLRRLGGAWDAGWYVRIVETGYSVSNGLIGKDGIPYSPRAFFPLFPALADPLHWWLPVSAGTALVLISSAAGVVAAWGIYACAAHCHNHRAGVISVVLWGALPLAAIENLAYSESLFTALAAWTLYAVLTARWLWAGALCVLAGLTRPTAMALSAAVALAALVELGRWRRDGGSPVRWWRPLAAGLLAPLGWAGYMLWTGWVEGSWGAYFHIQDAWGSSFDGGVSAVRRLLHTLTGAHSHLSQGHATAALPGHHSVGGAAVGVSMSVVMIVTLMAYLALFTLTVRGRQPLVLLVFSAALLLMDLGNASSTPPLARFLLPGFAFVFPLAEWLARSRSRWLPVTLLGACALLSGIYGVFVVFVGSAPPA
ncbi:glycosyltransferase family 39 protein [Streptacidiphilus sp. P02-A3a]|uniref:glycosyltransferase family 39 protein n=1 Tax=Streptacidiphilus sp. P02-A3a TaxID=2704468 RepID=UPI0015F908E1|nr:glycosyltransferase family 39 protein [Streptacidiphilus sp. P02-A3a]QMU73083.1 hypothetical protein GXP74_37430 [Streptacidiphilus sp. P02-A3a]